MKKIYLFSLLLALTAPITNSYCAAAMELEDDDIRNCEETQKMFKEFNRILSKQNFEEVESFLAKNIKSLNELKLGIFLHIVSEKVRDNRSIAIKFATRIIKLLISFGADITLKEGPNQVTIFHSVPDLAIQAVEEIESEQNELHSSIFSCSALPKEIIEIVQSYHSSKTPKLKNHEVLNSKAWGDRTPLHYVGWFSPVPAKGVKLLIDYGADLNAKDVNGQTPIFAAIDGPMGSRMGKIAILKLLIDAQADVNFKLKWCSTPLHQAVQANKIHAAKILIAAKADLTATDLWKKTPLDFAKINQNKAVITLLEEAAKVKKRKKPA